MNEMNFWNGLTDEEKKVAIEAVTAFQEEKQRKERIEALKEEVFNNVGTLYNLMDCDEWDDFARDLTHDFPMEIFQWSKN